ncbi:MAG: hypothetical protein SFU91_11195 [Chloroherpetonaceae bacterium]|nr:hypothetical protein [Chloroherpetonaceae bacterium]
MTDMKTLEYYLGLHYPIEIKPIPQSEGGGFLIGITQLGKHVHILDGDSIEHAVSIVQMMKIDFFKRQLEVGGLIPEPMNETIDENFARVPLRIPKPLYSALIRLADASGLSLNQYVAKQLASSAVGSMFSTVTKEQISRCKELLKTQAISLNLKRTPSNAA